MGNRTPTPGARANRMVVVVSVLVCLSSGHRLVPDEAMMVRAAGGP